MAEPNIEQLATVETPKIPKSGSIGFQEALGIQQPFIQRKAQITQDIGAATREEATATQAQKEGLAQAKAGAQEAYAGAERGAREQYQQRLETEPLPEFIPTKDNVQDIASLFSLIGVIGMVAGKGDAMKAMNAMNGMLEGHRKGRADLYKQEKQTFESNFKSMLKKHEEFRKEMEDAIKTAATDREAAMQKAELAATKAGSAIVQAQLRKGDLMGAYKLVDESGKGVQNALDIEAKQRRAVADREAAMERARFQAGEAMKRTQMQISAADARAKLKAETAGKGGIKPSAKIQEGYIADNQLKSDVDDIVKDLKTNPNLVNNLKKYRIEAFLTEEGKVLNQLVNEDIPPDLRQFLTKVRDMRNNYYLNISGKAVTGGEALRNYGTVPQPGDSPEAMLDKLQGMSNRINQSISTKRQLYNLPDLQMQPGLKTSLEPDQNYGVGAGGGQSKFQVGKVYTDAAGNQGRYMGVDSEGNDIWEEQ